MIPGGIDNGLVSSARLHESSISIPFSLVMVWMVVLVSQVSGKENGLAFRVRHVLVQGFVRSIGLSKITYKNNDSLDIDVQILVLNLG